MSCNINVSVNKTTVTDPDGRISIIYTDKKGRKIQTEQTKVGLPLNTMFYSYDPKDRLMRAWTVRNTYDEWATANDIDFIYLYDWNDNILQKYIPGAAYQGFVNTGANCSLPPIYNSSTTDLDVNDLFMLDLRYDNPTAAYAPAGTTATPQ